MTFTQKMEARSWRWLPGFVPAHKVYLSIAQSRIPVTGRVLHLGAGRDALGICGKLPGRRIVAVDPDGAGLAQNPAPEKVQASGESMPFSDDSFDAIMCEHVFEHLERPLEVLVECARVLRPGGQLIFLTPNRWSYIALAAALSPYRWHVRYKSLMSSTAEMDTFPTFYRLNTRATIESIAGQGGLRLTEFRTFVGWPTYLERGEWVHRAGVLLHWALGRLPSAFHISFAGVLAKA